LNPTRNRVRIDIDGRSYLQTYNCPDIKRIIIFIHGILGDYKESWNDTPAQLMTERVFVDFDWGSFGYHSRVIDWRAQKTLVDQLVLWQRTHLAAYQDIFIIAHSMGGLLLRYACANLVESELQEDRELFTKIKRCFLLAVPLSGSRVARRLSSIPLIRRLNSHLPFLAKPSVQAKDMGESYRGVISKAESLGLARPTFSLFIGTDDRIVSQPETWATTQDDRYEGAIPGTHSTLKEDLTANSTLIRRITQLIAVDLLTAEDTQRARIDGVRGLTVQRERANAARRGTPLVATATGSGTDERDVIIISCSSHKSDDGNVEHPGEAGIGDVLADDQLATLALRMRIKIMAMIQTGNLNGVEFREGNRALRPENRALILGPDFGGISNERRYMPAYYRYMGRCYQATREEWQRFYEQPEGRRPQIMIMSALYGLFPAQEYIQNYDCHLTDVDEVSGVSVQTYWRDRELMTQILVSYLTKLEERGVRIRRIIDLLSELSYQETIHWQMIYPRWPVFHRVFNRKAGRDALGNMGIWLRSVIVDHTLLENLSIDTFYDQALFLANDRIAFEGRIGDSTLEVARETAE
jgi:pimeloyl-ACP methyl ester carboxylesterase